MTISRQEWQNDLRERIVRSFPKIRAAGINSGYAILAASAILPVILSGAEWFTALVTLVGGVGAELIANKVQGAADEVDLARKLDNLSDNDQTHEYIKILLEKLDAQSIAQQGLPESDWYRLEDLLDRKLSQFSGQISSRQGVEVLKIKEKKTSSQARQIARSHIQKNKRVQSQQKKARIDLHHWPLAQYKARYLVRYQIEETERDKDDDGYVKNIRTVIRNRSKENTPVELAIFPRKSVHSIRPELVDSVYGAINKTNPTLVLCWDSRFLEFGYEKVHLPFWRWLGFVFNFRKGFTGAAKKLNVSIFGDTQQNISKSFIEVSESLALSDSQNTAKTLLAEEYNAISGRVFIDAMPTQEDITYFLYPFWEFSMGQRAPSTIVIDGVNDNILYQRSPANLLSKILIGFEMIVAGLLLIAFLGIFIYFLSILLEIFI
jgi:hypothetical protein